ncbi:MAG: aminodeoxychorismate synthase component I [Methylococcales bacterium]|nr:aminodeoxychorismate synthase component I [Methylococcales bacterium]MCK5924867.1 aminodeoxychorismate synthase component I [Methylococcales bacterium]
MSLLAPRLHALPYFNDSAKLFAIIADQSWAIFLDSASPYSQQGRYDIFACDPRCTLVTEGQVTTITTENNHCTSIESPFELIKQYLPNLKSSLELPFNGGALGYFSYDLTRRLEKLPDLAKDAEDMPDMAVGIYYWAVVVDHHQQQSWLVGVDIDEHCWQQLIKKFSVIQQSKPAKKFKILQSPHSNMSKTFYSQAFDKIKYYLTEGDCYQINLTQRFESPCEGDSWEAYQTLRQLNPAPFCAYLNFPKVQILSSSPERFLKIKARAVETKPIKGTRPRKKSTKEDQQQITELLNSEKDRAENLMIVDLLRNDLSKSCEAGSVKVPSLFSVESYATVHHLVSTVKGVLAKNQQPLDLFKRCFPGGSITGAPKIRAMEIIEELEPNRRGLYCGSIAYIGFNGNMDSSITIRTLVNSNNIIRFWAGGGIVNDSVMEEEYQESFDKAAAMLAMLDQFNA